MKELSTRRVSNTWINDEFGELKAIHEFGDWWFEAYTVAKKLGYRNPPVSVKQHVWKEFMRNDIPGCVNKINGLNKIMLNISGVLQLIMCSKADNAKRFQKWVYVDVLPSIMFNGGYIRNQENLPIEQLNVFKTQIVNMKKVIEIQGNTIADLTSKIVQRTDEELKKAKQNEQENYELIDKANNSVNLQLELGLFEEK